MDALCVTDYQNPGGATSSNMREKRKNWESDLLDGLDPASIFGASSQEDATPPAPKSAKRQESFRVRPRARPLLTPAGVRTDARWYLDPNPSAPQDQEDRPLRPRLILEHLYNTSASLHYVARSSHVAMYLVPKDFVWDPRVYLYSTFLGQYLITELDRPIPVTDKSQDAGEGRLCMEVKLDPRK